MKRASSFESGKPIAERFKVALELVVISRSFIKAGTERPRVTQVKRSKALGQNSFQNPSVMEMSFWQIFVFGSNLAS
jgi:hypothetical protein